MTGRPRLKPTRPRPATKPTSATEKRSAEAVRRLQGLEKGQDRPRVCNAKGCQHVEDLRLGPFKSPAGVDCRRCGTRVTEGVVVLVGFRR